MCLLVLMCQSLSSAGASGHAGGAANPSNISGSDARVGLGQRVAPVIPQHRESPEEAHRTRSVTWQAPDYAALTAFLVQTHSFNEQRVARYVERLKACRASGTQMRLDSFFKAGAPKAVPNEKKFDAFAKRPKGGAAAGSKRAGKQPVGAGGGKKPKK